jgi:hemerythrin-like domain-containing protein
MAAMIEVLREEHRNIGRLLRALEHQIEIFASGDPPDYDVIVGVADYFLDYPDRCHHPKEDLIISKLREAHPQAAANIADLSHEHRALHLQARRFRETVAALLNDTDIPRSQIVDAGRDFIDAQWQHLRMEESSFLPVADRLLTPADWADIESRRSQRTDPVFGGRVEELFRTLSERLLAWEAEDERSAS